MNVGEYIKKLRTDYGYSQEQLGAMIGVKRAAVQKWESGKVQNLKRETIKKLSEIFNVSPSSFVDESSLEVLYDNIIPLPKTKNIPLLGDIACGEPILATENIADYIKVDLSIKADFALRCKGDSMINARIFDGDIVYIRQQSDVDDGEIAAVLIGDEATLKKVYKTENKLVLRPCNPMYDDLVYSNDTLNEVRILGKAIMFTSLIRHGK